MRYWIIPYNIKFYNLDGLLEIYDQWYGDTEISLRSVMRSICTHLPQ